MKPETLPERADVDDFDYYQKQIEFYERRMDRLLQTIDSLGERVRYLNNENDFLADQLTALAVSGVASWGDLEN
jgi:hypothetical protein